MDVDTEGIFSPDCPDPGDNDVIPDQMIMYRSSDDEEDYTHHQGQVHDIPAGAAMRMIPRPGASANAAPLHIVE